VKKKESEKIEKGLAVQALSQPLHQPIHLSANLIVGWLIGQFSFVTVMFSVNKNVDVWREHSTAVKAMTTSGIQPRQSAVKLSK